MIKFYLIVLALFFSTSSMIAQQSKLSCTEVYKPNKENPHLDSLIVNTCLINNFKFISTAHPDYAGRYFYYEYEVYKKSGTRFIKTSNADFFNERQNELLAEINNRIQGDYKTYRSDSTTASCFESIDSFPLYEMDDLGITFHEDEIRFSVTWDLPIVCRSVGGSIVSFKLNKVEKYFKRKQ